MAVFIRDDASPARSVRCTGGFTAAATAGSGRAPVELLGYFRVLGYDAQLEAQQALILDIISLAEEVGVSFAFPTQTLHMAETTADEKTIETA